MNSFDPLGCHLRNASLVVVLTGVKVCMTGSGRVNSSKVKLETTHLSALGAKCHPSLTLVSKLE